MKEQAGKIIDFVRENRTVPGCTISKQKMCIRDRAETVFNSISYS